AVGKVFAHRRTSLVRPAHNQKLLAKNLLRYGGLQVDDARGSYLSSRCLNPRSWNPTSVYCIAQRNVTVDSRVAYNADRRYARVKNLFCVAGTHQGPKRRARLRDCGCDDLPRIESAQFAGDE